MTEEKIKKYALLAEMDFEHPLLAPFGEPRFSDFTKIRFWKHRRIDVLDDSAVQVVARFDDGDPAVIESLVDRGRIVVLSTGWQPADSRFALSSKFVPWMTGLLRDFDAGSGDAQRLHVGDPLLLASDQTMSDSNASAGKIVKPDGTVVSWKVADRSFRGIDQPGHYRIQAGDTVRSVAVNLNPQESDTRVLPVEALEERGVLLGVQPTPKDMADHARQMRDLELEDRQKVWQWIVVALVCVLILETWLAGRLERNGADIRPTEAVE